jgi:hypothetical protein
MTVARILEQPDEYRATMMIATTMNPSTSERTRSSIFDLGFGAASGGGMAYFGGCSSPVKQPTAPDWDPTLLRFVRRDRIWRIRMCEVQILWAPARSARASFAFGISLGLPDRRT